MDEFLEGTAVLSPFTAGLSRFSGTPVPPGLHATLSSGVRGFFPPGNLNLTSFASPPSSSLGSSSLSSTSTTMISSFPGMPGGPVPPPPSHTSHLSPIDSHLRGLPSSFHHHPQHPHHPSITPLTPASGKKDWSTSLTELSRSHHHHQQQQQHARDLFDLSRRLPFGFNFTPHSLDDNSHDSVIHGGKLCCPYPTSPYSKLSDPLRLSVGTANGNPSIPPSVSVSSASGAPIGVATPGSLGGLNQRTSHPPPPSSALFPGSHVNGHINHHYPLFVNHHHHHLCSEPCCAISPYFAAAAAAGLHSTLTAAAVINCDSRLINQASQASRHQRDTTNGVLVNGKEPPTVTITPIRSSHVNIAPTSTTPTKEDKKLINLHVNNQPTPPPTRPSSTAASSAANYPGAYLTTSNSISSTVNSETSVASSLSSSSPSSSIIHHLNGSKADRLGNNSSGNPGIVVNGHRPLNFNEGGNSKLNGSVCHIKDGLIDDKKKRPWADEVNNIHHNYRSHNDNYNLIGSKDGSTNESLPYFQRKCSPLTESRDVKPERAQITPVVPVKPIEDHNRSSVSSSSSSSLSHSTNSIGFNGCSVIVKDEKDSEPKSFFISSKSHCEPCSTKTSTTTSTTVTTISTATSTISSKLSLTSTVSNCTITATVTPTISTSTIVTSLATPKPSTATSTSLTCLTSTNSTATTVSAVTPTAVISSIPSLSNQSTCNTPISSLPSINQTTSTQSSNATTVTITPVVSSNLIKPENQATVTPATNSQRSVIKQLKDYKIFPKNGYTSLLEKSKSTPTSSTTKETKTIEVQCDGPDWTPIVLPTQYRNRILKHLNKNKNHVNHAYSNGSLIQSASGLSESKDEPARKRRKSDVNSSATSYASSSTGHLDSSENTNSSYCKKNCNQNNSSNQTNKNDENIIESDSGSNIISNSKSVHHNSTNKEITNSSSSIRYNNVLSHGPTNDIEVPKKKVKLDDNCLNNLSGDRNQGNSDGITSNYSEISKSVQDSLSHTQNNEKCKKKYCSSESTTAATSVHQQQSIKKKEVKSDKKQSGNKKGSSSSLTSSPSSAQITGETSVIKPPTSQSKSTPKVSFESGESPTASPSQAPPPPTPTSTSSQRVRRRRFRSGLDMIRSTKNRKKAKPPSSSPASSASSSNSAHTNGSKLKDCDVIKGKIGNRRGEDGVPSSLSRHSVGGIGVGSGSSSPASVSVPIEIKRIMVNKALGETILHRAARQGYTHIVSYCLATNACDINARDNAGYTPLHECCSRGHLDIARALLEHGADVNASATGGVRPFHDAVESDHIEIVRLLLAYGSDPTIATYTGLTPLKLARSSRMIEFLRGFIYDLTGEIPPDPDQPSRPILPWKFNGSSRFMDPKPSGFEIFDEDSVPCDDECDDLDDLMLEISDTPHLPTYRIKPGITPTVVKPSSLSKSSASPKGSTKKSPPSSSLSSSSTVTQNYLKLCDILKQMDLSKDQFIGKFKNIEILCLSTCNLESNILTSWKVHHGHDASQQSGEGSSQLTEIVLLDDSIREILGIETFRVP